MAEVHIVLKDKFDGKVEVVVSPNIEFLLSILESGSELTSAQGYAVSAINKIRDDAKNKANLQVFVPRVGK